MRLAGCPVCPAWWFRPNHSSTPTSYLPSSILMAGSTSSLVSMTSPGSSHHQLMWSSTTELVLTLPMSTSCWMKLSSCCLVYRCPAVMGTAVSPSIPQPRLLLTLTRSTVFSHNIDSGVGWWIYVGLTGFNPLLNPSMQLHFCTALT